jgi:HD-GYP domain-containing protein (c-di-GMP phosphodiesterase class II)
MELKTENLIPIPSIDFTEEPLTFDLYAQLPNLKKTILYRKQGAEIESDRFAIIQEQTNIVFLIQRDHYVDYLKHVAGRLKALLQNNVDAQDSQNLAQIARTLLLSSLQTTSSQQSQLMLKSLNEICSVIVSELIRSPQVNQLTMYNNFLKLARIGSNFQKHPINVMSLALMIATGIGHNNRESLRDLMMASLVHDLGLVRLPIKVIQNAHKPQELGLSDRHLLHQHPALTLEILDSKEIYLSQRAKNIVLQHHEEFNGRGYPNGLNGYAIEPLSQILSLADTFDHFINEPQRGRSVFESIQVFFQKLNREKSLAPQILQKTERLLGIA